MKGSSLQKRRLSPLKAQNFSLLDQTDDLENRSRWSNLHIINIPEGSEDGKDSVGFISGLLKDTMESVFDSPPELELVLGPKPGPGQSPRSFIVCLHRFQEKALHWARRHDVKFNGVSLRLYPDTSAALAQKCAGFKEVKQSLYQRGIKFQLLHQFTASEDITDPQGRCVIVSGSLYHVPGVLVDVYVPNWDDVSFINKLVSLLPDFNSYLMIFGGDHKLCYGSIP